MSIFVDSGVLYPMHDTDASRHETSKTAFRSVVTGGYGRLFTSDYVYDEAVTLTRSRTGRFDLARAVGDRIAGETGQNVFELLFVDEPRFEESRRTFERYSDHDLSFTDATIIALVEAHDIDAVLSFDDDFDGIVDRIDPRELA